MNSQRLTTAFEMSTREFLRRRGMLSIIILVPIVGFGLIYLGLPRTPASLEAIENGVKVTVEMNQVELFSGFGALSFVGLLSGVVGLYLMRSALTADRRLRVAGFAAAELLIARLTLLVLVDAALAAFLVLITSLFAPPQQLIPFYIAIFFAAVLYSFYGALFALFIRNEMGGILAITFLANIDVGYLQLPGYSTVLEEWWIKLLPGYFPVQLAIDAAFTDTAELFLTSLWAIPHGLMIAGFMLGAYQQATEIRPFMPEESGRRFGKLLLFVIGAGLLTAAGVFGYLYASAQPPVVQTDGRVDAPSAQVIPLVSGRIRELRVQEGQPVAEGAIVAWLEDEISQRTLPVRAPITGQVTSLPVRQGENIVQGSPLATIHDLARLEVRLEVAETDIARIAEGQRVELNFASLDAKVITTVREIGTEPLPAEPGTTETTKRIRKYAVKVYLPNPDPRLRLDMAVQGKIYY